MKTSKMLLAILVFCTSATLMIACAGQKGNHASDEVAQAVPEDTLPGADNAHKNDINPAGNQDALDVTEDAADVDKKPADKAENAADDVRDTADKLGDDIKDTADKISDDVKDTANDIADDAKNTADQLGDDVRDTVDNLGDDIKDAADSAKSAGRAVRNAAGGNARRSR